MSQPLLLQLTNNFETLAVRKWLVRRARDPPETGRSFNLLYSLTTVDPLHGNVYHRLASILEDCSKVENIIADVGTDETRA